tara:strand:- start:74 stop:1597 length:1524 start_codon:yes stop_codon:yes gene_type:complete
MGTTSSFFGGGGGGGDPQANFKASANISANDLVVLNANGTVAPMSTTASTAGSGSLQDAGTGACSNVMSHGHYDEVANVAVNIYKRSGVWKLKAASNSGGTLTYGTEVNAGITPPADAESCCRLTYDTVNKVYVAWGNGSSNSLYFRSFTVSGNTITLIGSGATHMYYYFWRRFDCLYLPDVETHVVMGSSNGQITRFSNVNTAADGTATSPYAGSGNQPSAGVTIAAITQRPSITDMGGGLVGCLRESSNQNNRAFFQGSATTLGTTFSQINNTTIQLGFGGPTSDLGFVLADKHNKKIMYICTSGSSDVKFRIFTYTEFLSAGTYTSSISSSLSGFPELAIAYGAACNAVGEIFVYFADGKNTVYRFNIGEGFMSNTAVAESPSGSHIGGNGTVSPSNFSPEAWVLGLNSSTDAAQARNFTFKGVNTNEGSFLGTAPEDISAGALGKVNLTNRDLTKIDVKSVSNLVSGQSYFENSTGNVLTTTGTNLVGFGSNGGLKVIGAPVT